MQDDVVLNIKKGLAKIRNNPQLFYTSIVALVIIVAFLFMADRFITVANDAQDRLVNVRIGSIHDSFVTFAEDRIEDGAYLNKHINAIKENNETIRSFRVVRKVDLVQGSTVIPNAYAIIASDNSTEIGQTLLQADFLYGLAISQPNHSVTIQYMENGERMFSTARAIVDQSKNILGVVMTSQTLSQADKKVERNVNNSLAVLFVVIVLIVFLFLRYSKVVDYMHLYRKLKEVDQLKDDFIGMASHELRTPLTSIRGYAEFMREAPELSSNTREYAMRIDTSAKELDSLVVDILDVSKIQQGRMEFKFEKVRPKEIIQEVVSASLIEAENKGLQLTFEAGKEDDTWCIEADKVRLKQVLVNLIGNALKYTKKGSVKVSEEMKDASISIRVEDTGIGISAAERERLFERFYRIRTKETEDIRGTGLGLWITAKIVKEMGGEIQVESIKGVGSHFVVSFPIVS